MIRRKTPEQREKLWRREMARLDDHAITALSDASKKKNSKKQRPRSHLAFQLSHWVTTLDEVQQAIETGERDEALLRVISLKKEFKEIISNDKKHRTLISIGDNV
jgi:hypothetical protein